VGEALFNRLHGPRDMMIKTELGDGTSVYLSLPRSEARRSVPRI
jgi:hypothetical protein